MKKECVKKELVDQQNNLPLDATDRRQLLDKHIATIKAAYTEAGKAYLSICFSLYEINRLKLYTEKGFKNIETFAQNTFDIQKTRTYEYLKVVEILGDIKDDGSCTELKSEYLSYSVSKICLLPNVDEKDRQQMNSEWTVKQIKSFIKNNRIKDKAKKEPKPNDANKEKAETDFSESKGINNVPIPSTEIENVVVPDNVSEPKSFSFTTSKDRLSELMQILSNKLTELSFASDFTERDILFLIHIE